MYSKRDFKKESKNYSKLNIFLKIHWKSLFVYVFFIFLILLVFSSSLVNISQDKNTLDIIKLLVSSESTIIAIVITLSLVAVQLASSSYSNRVMDIFQKSHSFWSIVLLYIVAILIGLITLILAQDNQNTFLLGKLTLIDYYLGIVSIAALIPFIWITFDLLKPSTVINRLKKGINKDRILECIANEANDDPTQPIIDIIQSSLLKYDNNTVKQGLDSINNSFEDIINNNLSNQEKNKIIRYFSKHFNRISNLAIAEMDEESLSLIIKIFLENGVLSSKWEYENEIFQISISFITNISKVSVDKNMRVIGKELAIYLGELGAVAVKNKNKVLVHELLYALEHLIEIDTINSFNSMEKIEKTILNYKFEDIEPISVFISLVTSLRNSLENNNDILTSQILYNSFELMEIAIENKLEFETALLALTLRKVRNESIKNKDYLTASEIPMYLEKFIDQK